MFRACFARLFTVFVGGIALAALGYFAVVSAIAELLDMRETVVGLALSLSAQVLLLTVVGTLLTAIAATVFVEHAAGRKVGADRGWRRLKPNLGNVVVAGLYVAMPLLMAVLFLGRTAQFFFLPLALGPPVLVHAIAWEGWSFRDASTRAKNLLSGSWLRVIGALLMLVLGALLVQLVAGGLAAAVLPPVRGGDVSAALITTVALVLTTAPVWLFAAAAGTVAYLDLRARFEELDATALRAEAESLDDAPREAPSQG